MDFINLLLSATQPSGMWAKIIFGLEKGIGSYGWTLIVVTLLIRLVLLPTDFLNRYITKVNTRKMAVLQPELNKIQKAYGNNKDMLNRKTMELYKRENYSVVGTCLGMLVSLVLTTVVFFTLCSSLNKISSYKIYTEFETLQTTYNEVYNAGYSETLTETELEQLKARSEAAVVVKYGEIKEDFLWVKNIWRADTSQSVIPKYKDFTKLINKVQGVEEKPTEEEYNKVMNCVANANSGWNGYYILTILAAIATFVSAQIPTWIAKIKAKKRHEVYAPVQQNQIMSYLLPLVMALFTLFYTASFAIYIVVGSLFAMITQPVLTIIVDAIDSKKAKKEQESKKVSYSRK